MHDLAKMSSQPQLMETPFIATKMVLQKFIVVQGQYTQPKTYGGFPHSTHVEMESCRGEADCWRDQDVHRMACDTLSLQVFQPTCQHG
jgi:hypothetical protein